MPCRAHLGGSRRLLFAEKSSRKIDFPSRTRKRFHNNLSTLCKITENSQASTLSNFHCQGLRKVLTSLSSRASRGNMGQCNSRTQQTLVPFTYIHVRRSTKSPKEELRRSKTKVFLLFKVIHERQLAEPRDAAIISRSYVRN